MDNRLNINLIIFSKNRAAQLDLLLRSINKNAENLFDNIWVIYTTTDDYENGYYILSGQHPSVYFLREPYGQFKTFFEHQLGKFDNNDLLCHMTDDCVVYNNINEYISKDEILSLFEDVEELNCLSLRVGLNTKIQTYHKGDVLPPLNYVSDHNLIFWNHKSYSPHSPFGYCYSLDGHIFRGKDITPLIKSISYSDPNSLESSLSFHSHNPKTKPTMAALANQCLVALPVNVVNTAWNNPHAKLFSHPAPELNKRYMNGDVIDLDDLCMQLQNNDCTHTEREYKYMEKEIEVDEYKDYACDLCYDYGDLYDQYS